MALLALHPVAFAWDPTGHLLVGEIAWRHLNPAARNHANALLAEIDPRFNGGTPYHFVTAGCWMDDVRADRSFSDWGKWHFVNCPWTPSGTPFAEPEPPHILWAIDRSLETLRSGTASRADAARALGHLIHLIGDLHQPLHATTWDDAGGNGYLIFGVPFTDLFPNQTANLHTFWDKAFRFSARDGEIYEQYPGLTSIESRPTTPSEGPIQSLADEILARFPKSRLFQLAPGQNHRDWARESHLIGCLAAYPDEPHPRDTGGVKLNPEFVARANAIASERIALAGYRLAETVNALFATEP